MAWPRWSKDSAVTSTPSLIPLSLENHRRKTRQITMMESFSKKKIAPKTSMSWTIWSRPRPRPPALQTPPTQVHRHTNSPAPNPTPFLQQALLKTRRCHPTKSRTPVHPSNNPSLNSPPPSSAKPPSMADSGISQVRY